MRRYLSALFSASVISLTTFPAASQTHLTTDLIEHTDVTYVGGRVAEIRSSCPGLGWVLDSGQKAYRIVLRADDGSLIWDSGRVRSPRSTNIRCGAALSPSKTYRWSVTVWTGKGRRCSEEKTFVTAPVLDDSWSFYPLEETPVEVVPEKVADRLWFADFSRDAYGKPRVVIDSPRAGKATVRFGESLAPDGSLQRNPKGSVRFASYELDVLEGEHSYDINLAIDPRHQSRFGTQSLQDEPPVMMPEYIGEVFPFRYMEIETDGTPLRAVRLTVNHPFDDDAASFHCSDSTLNAVWELCRYSMKATSFCGIYVDGDRERIPYEADALINQIGHYCTDREYTMARRSLDYLIFHPTWPTEWTLQIPIIAWRDLLYTGDTTFVSRRYDELVAKAMIPLRDSRGLISTVVNDMKDVQEAVHYHRQDRIHDIVDWPRVGTFGAPGEDDSYVLTDYNTVVNAYHYQALRMLSDIASVLGRQEDEERFSSLAAQTCKSLIECCFDPSDGAFRDGIGTGHKALHATLFPLAFGMVPEESLGRTLEFVRSKGMACSVYAAQMLLEGLYDAGDDEYALSLMTSHGDRSWYNMLREGSTITMEAWGQRYKSNQDWNHAWGAAPANIIPRKVLGVEPLTPGCDEVTVHPHPGTLQYAEGTVPTIKGPVHVRFDRNPDGTLDIKADAPGGVRLHVVK